MKRSWGHSLRLAFLFVGQLIIYDMFDKHSFRPRMPFINSPIAVFSNESNGRNLLKVCRCCLSAIRNNWPGKWATRNSLLTLSAFQCHQRYAFKNCSGLIALWYEVDLNISYQSTSRLDGPEHQILRNCHAEKGRSCLLHGIFLGPRSSSVKFNQLLLGSQRNHSTIYFIRRIINQNIMTEKNHHH